jgi:pSer/pThr/pTyr-binding forkhead associated (FHA) protein
MLHGRLFRTGQSNVDNDERARMKARLEALEPDSGDATRQIGPPSEASDHSYDGSLAQPESQSPTSYDVEPRAYLLTSDGGVLAELVCTPGSEPMTLGRGHAADICIADPYVHRLQSELYWDASVQAHFIAHAGGENGTYVNRHRVHQPLRLVGGEQIRVGKTKLQYRIRR